MRERAEAIRAKLRIESRIDQGTAVLLNWQAGQKNKGSKTKKPGEAADE
jgi:nitrate/nitrite-specific signal transduction histidine kinase